MVLVGGRFPLNCSGVMGTVTFVSTSGKSTQAGAGTGGRFTVEVAPGTYTVTGSSSLHWDGKGVCRADSVFVRTGTNNPVTVALPQAVGGAGRRSERPDASGQGERTLGGRRCPHALTPPDR